MTESNEKQPIKKRLNLIFPVDGVSAFEVGGDGANCDAITRQNDGSYDVLRGSALLNIPGARVSHYFQ